jgi:deazaflavin-dependent oxidoreductase (nitroreductase family)
MTTNSGTGLRQALRYRIPRPNAAQRAVWRVSASRPGAWLFGKALHHLDKALLGLSRGQLTLPGVLAGLPVLTLTTTGARSGRRRSTPLIGVPAGDDIAVIGTRFGQPGTPGWYYNLRANPAAEVTYQSTSVSVVAREADGAEWRAIWASARRTYAGYEAYARRITGRPIHIMVLSQDGPDTPIREMG